MPDRYAQYEAIQDLHVRNAQRRIKRLYENVINAIAASMPKGKIATFSLNNYPGLKKRIDQQINKLHTQINGEIVSSIKQSWQNANVKNDNIADRRFVRRKPSAAAKQILYDPNKDALNSFLARKERGMSLSDRIWKGLAPFRPELERGLAVSISEGIDARETARELQRYLNEPDKLFRRVKDAEGKLRLSNAAKEYHPGQGVYRSSFKNAFRLTRTENNIAYRTADFERWNKLPFVTGIEIRLSAQHPKYDICDELKGSYPKEFKFTGWHPQCLCNQVPKMMSDAEYNELEDQILAGEPITVKSEGQISKPPPQFKEYVRENKKRIADWKNQPYWVKDNPEYVSL